jgi:hypothetical protein
MPLAAATDKAICFLSQGKQAGEQIGNRKTVYLQKKRGGICEN